MKERKSMKVEIKSKNNKEMTKGSNYERQSQYEIKFQKGSPAKNSLFGEHFIYFSKDSKDNKKIVCVEKMFNDRSSLNKAIAEVKKKILNKHDYILNLLDYSVEV